MTALEEVAVWVGSAEGATGWAERIASIESPEGKAIMKKKKSNIASVLFNIVGCSFPT